MKYKVILFDADDTLFDFQKAEVVAFENTVKAFGMDYEASYHYEMYHQINTQIWHEFEKGTITQETLKVERFRRFCEQAQIAVNAKDFAKSYMEHLGQCSFLLEGAYGLVERLSQTHILGIITNGLTMVQEERIKKSKIAKFFKTIVISESIGISKPDPKIFEHTLQQLDVFEKKSVLMIGDSLTSDIKGGINFGIDTCWYNPKGIVNHSDIIATYEIEKLESIHKQITHL